MNTLNLLSPLFPPPLFKMHCRMATVWTLVQHSLSDLVQNWDLQRPYTASLATRVEGFTEEWGGAANDTTALLDDTPPTIATLHPPCKIRLFQYRPAWGEQLALRIATIQYVVVNSKYAVWEVTGPLPSLQDLRHKNERTMVGRNHFWRP